MTLESVEYPSHEFKLRFFATPSRDDDATVAAGGAGRALASSFSVSETCKSSWVMLYLDNDFVGRFGVVKAVLPLVIGSVKAN